MDADSHLPARTIRRLGDAMTTHTPPLTPQRDHDEPRVPRLPLDEAQQIAKAVDMNPDLARIHLFQVLLNAPRVGAAINLAKDVALKEGTLAPRLRELAIMRTAWLMGAEYVWNHHTRPHVEHHLELNPSDILEVRNWEQSTTLDERDRTLLRLTDEMVLAPGGEASTETVAAAAEAIGSAGLVELVVTIGLYRAISSIARTLAVPMEAEYGHWEPDGVGPAATAGDG